MSAAHRGQRPKGYMSWRPSPDVAEVVGHTLTTSTSTAETL